MGKNHRTNKPCPKCGEMGELKSAGRYHCNNSACPVFHFKVDWEGNYYSITYCADVEGERG